MSIATNVMDCFLAGWRGGLEIKSVLINNLSHGTYYDETPSPDELKDACDDAIRIVERYAKGQLEVPGHFHAPLEFIT